MSCRASPGGWPHAGGLGANFTSFSIVFLISALAAFQRIHATHDVAVNVYNGLDPYPQIGLATCTGREKEWADCGELLACPSLCRPVQCVFSGWSAWQNMGGCIGLCSRQRGIEVSNNECGSPCQGPVIQTIESPECLDDDCAVSFTPCTWGAWSEWSACQSSSGDKLGQSYRGRKIEQFPEGGGAACTGPWNQTRPCGTEAVAACVLSDWAGWSECSVSCGGGWHAQMRRIFIQAQHGGRTCEGVTRRTASCNTQPCGQVSECQVAEWGDWVGCVSDSGDQRYRSREIIHGNEYVYKACNYTVRETAGCPKPWEAEKPACSFGPWSIWGPCSAPCEGQAIRRREIQPTLLAQSCRWESSHSQLVTQQTQPCGQRSCWTGSEASLSAWSEWSACSQSCGRGLAGRSRSLGPSGSPIAADGSGVALSEVRECLLNECGKTDCLWGAWDSWSACTCSCGGGTKRRTRIIVSMPRLGGRLCDPMDKSEVAACATQSCEVCLDGAWGPWDQWSSCSASCGPAIRVRHRDVVQRPSACGRAASGLEDEYELCDQPSCQDSMDCLLSEWDAWSSCSCHCFGNQERHRHIVRYASGDGSPCVEEALKQISPCNPGPGEAEPSECGPAPEKPCQPTAWAEWSHCSASCDGGQRTRSRSILAPNANGGHPCELALTETAPCGMEPCEQRVCSDCIWGPWSDWGGCSSCGGQRYRHRQIEQMPNECGRICGARPAKEAGGCPTSCGEASYCVWSDWTDVGGCKGSCGAASLVRQRQLELVLERPAASAESIGDLGACLDASGRRYEAYVAEATPSTSSCAAFLEGLAGVPGVQGAEWSQEMGTCSIIVSMGSDPRSLASLSGRSFTRDSWRFGNGTGSILGADGREGFLCWRLQSTALVMGDRSMPCSGSQVSLVECSGSAPCAQGCQPQDCQFGEWAPWSEPLCTSQLCERHRSIAVANKCGGKACSGATGQTKQCPKDCSTPQDCTFRDWEEWDLPADCVLPKQRFRSRSVLHQGSVGGRPCEGSLEETQPCEPPDGPPSPCIVGPWSEWLACTRSCGGGLRGRSRGMDHLASGGGSTCEASLSEMEPCAVQPCSGLDLPCLFENWHDWGFCTDDRLSFRQRLVRQQPGYLGNLCMGALKEARPCDLQVEDCSLSAWSPWDPCDRACGGGQQQRHREVSAAASNGGQECEDSLVETRGCNINPCEDVACEVSEWSDWNRCSAICGAGQRFRHRDLTQMPSDGSLGCTMDLSQVEACEGERMDCLSVVDCSWGGWSTWGACSCSCDGGQRNRDRHIATMPSIGGKPCAAGDQEQVEACNTQPCHFKACIDGAWAQWGQWSACSKSCEGGVAWRVRKVQAEANECGTPAEGLSMQHRACNVHSSCSPRVDCLFAPWLQWSACTRACSSVKRRSRTIEVQGQGDGDVCEGPLKQTWPCNEGCSDGEAVVDCEFSQWDSWGSCSATCGSGQHQRERRIARADSGGGRGCGGILTEVGRCDVAPCSTCKSMDCQWGEWEDWSACDKCGGQRKHYRHIGVQPSCGGRSCEAGGAEEISNCTRQCHGEMFCVWHDWSSWGECSASCGQGRRVRERHLWASDERPAPSLNSVASKAALPSGAELNTQLELLQGRTAELETQRSQSLAAAFALGASSFIALAAIGQQMAKQKTRGGHALAAAFGPGRRGYALVATSDVGALE
mmetsp:Transcript_139273/g.445223  ORF Transcript_139273/g.445223 Transcript_139273/m.445223 type:complete len:1685 (-) Transcript_139273:136-5190(-)